MTRRAAKRRGTGFAAVVAVAVLAGAACGGDPEPAPRPFTAATLAGDSVTLSDLDGRPALVNIWATWCAPCRQEVPVLQALHEAHDSLRVVGITVDHGGAGDAIRRFASEMGMTYEVWWDPMGAVIDRFGATGVPLTVLLDREGRTVWRHQGAVEADDPALLRALEETF